MHPAKYLHIFSKVARQVGRFDPLRDWFVLLTFFGITLVGILAWNMWAFETVVDGGSIGSVEKVSAPAAFDSDSLDRVRSVIENRAAEEMKYKTGAYHFTDPSH